jgi:uncharacterized membrane protein YhaH (DUF805 family)
MNMVEAVKTCFIKYVDFKGRASRSEYWWFFLFCLIVEIIGHAINLNLYLIVALAVLLPSLTVLVRRLHDINRTGWWALILLIPVIGWIVILIFALMESTPGPNNYGLPPS